MTVRCTLPLSQQFLLKKWVFLCSHSSPPKAQVIYLKTLMSCSIALGVSHTYPGSIFLLHTVHCTQPPYRWSQSSPSAGYRSCSGKSLWRTCGPELVSAYRRPSQEKKTQKLTSIVSIFAKTTVFRKGDDKNVNAEVENYCIYYGGSQWNPAKVTANVNGL